MVVVPVVSLPISPEIRLEVSLVGLSRSFDCALAQITEAKIMRNTDVMVRIR